MKNYEEKVHETHSIVNDILSDCERGKCTWKEGVQQLAAEAEGLNNFLNQDEDECK